MNKIKVNLRPNSYEIIIGKNTFGFLLKYVKSVYPENRLFFVIDRKMYKLNKDKIDELLSKIPNRKTKFLLTSSERNKSYDSLIRIHREMLKSGCGRDCVVIAIGGGIIGDITGFAAATYMRGIDFIQIPTTLLAMVDSSVGGKTGINLDTTKNIIGAFHQPRMVICDLNFLSTLDEEEIICGMGEIAKYSFLTDKHFYEYFYKNFNKVINRNPVILNKLITESVNYKKSVVEKDEKESGLRKVLNLGHTFAHAIESVYNHKIKHGQAVVIGLAISLYLSNGLNLLNEKNLPVYFGLLEKFKSYIRLPKLNLNQLYKTMHSDKKNRLNAIRFVLLKDFGQLLLDVEVDKKEVVNAVKKGLEFFA